MTPTVESLLIAAGRRREAELLAEIERLKAESLRYYRADGTFETLASAEEVVKRRVEAAAEIERLKKALLRLAGTVDDPASGHYQITDALAAARAALRRAETSNAEPPADPSRG